MSDTKPYDATIARIAGNIAAGLVNHPEFRNLDSHCLEGIAYVSVDVAQRIVQKLTTAQRLEDHAGELLVALRDLKQNANRLCDRQLGGTYEDDCRKAIAQADIAIRQAEATT